jgi:hypothetical protein
MSEKIGKEVSSDYMRWLGLSLTLLVTFLVALGGTNVSATPAPTVTSSVNSCFSYGGYFPHGSWNWSGWAAQYSTTCQNNYTVTDVSGSWIQPSVNCSHNGVVQMWVGVDGLTTQMLNNDYPVQSNATEAVGTYAACQSGVATYYLWWGLNFTAPHRVSSVPLIPGDTVSASVRYVGTTGLFTFNISAGGQFFKKKATDPTALRQSAECLLTRPGLNHALANFGYGNFTSCYATISGVHGTILGFGVSVGLYMTNPARTSSLEFAARPNATTGGYRNQWNEYY